MTDTLNFQELKAAGALPSPKGVALMLMEQIQREDIALPELVHTILGDPALTGQIIKLANTVNPDRSRPVASVTVDTLLIVGIRAIRRAVIGLSLVSAYQTGTCRSFDYPKFWAHSSAMACVAQGVGTMVRIAPLPEVFVCGLLAEIGQLVFASARPESYSTLLQRYATEPLDTLMQAESQQFDIGRRALTAMMMEDWGIPQLYIDAVSFYDQPETADFAPGSARLNLALTLQLANQLATIYTSPEETRILMPAVIETGAKLNLGTEQIVSIANHAASDWMEWCGLLSLRTKAVPLIKNEWGMPR